MFQPRTLSSDESRFMHRNGVSVDLTEHPGEWYYLQPRGENEIVNLDGLDFRIGGPALLQSASTLGSAGARIEIGFDLMDGFGAQRDLAAVTFHSTESADEWNAGQHSGTVVAVSPSPYADGSQRSGLTGQPLRIMPTPDIVKWSGAEIPLRYGTVIEGATWQADLLRDPRGGTLPSVTIRLQVGTTAAGGAVTWTSYPVANTGAELEAGFVNFPAPLPRGDVMRWDIAMAYIQGGTAEYAEEMFVRTSRLFMLGAWLRLKSHSWRFDSLADLLQRAESTPQLLPLGWDGASDAAILRLTLDSELRGARKEQLKARIAFDQGVTTTTLTGVQIRAIGDLSFDSRP